MAASSAWLLLEKLADGVGSVNMPVSYRLQAHPARPLFALHTATILATDFE
jgi:hypothetical protein